MKRLTRKTFCGDYASEKDKIMHEHQEEYNKLGKYEDTGLTPEECAELTKEVSRLAIESVQREIELAKLEAEVAAWAEAEDQGRLVVLPAGLSKQEYMSVADYMDDLSKECSLSNGSVGIFASPQWEIDFYMELRDCFAKAAEAALKEKSHE